MPDRAADDNNDSLSNDNDDYYDDDAIPFAISEDLVQSPTHKQASITSTDFDGLLKEPLLLSEDLAKGNGGQAWPAGYVLAKYLLRRKLGELRNASIVELGAGGGLVGLAVAVGCRSTTGTSQQVVHITDQEPMLALMRQNIERNDLQGRVEACVYDWGAGKRPSSVPAQPDVVLAADCVYYEPAFPLLLQTLEELVGPQTVCYFCFKRRRRADMQFLKAAKKAFVVVDVEDDPEREVYAKENIFLCTIQRRVDR
ncbi:Protein-lysine N-methyltransferase efm6 [Friedmanniomyces endolithicus]|nr:Protein-lysine N-methyltransferase efm6 [Friedmanniomyces endolithicus]KAK0830260.1 Protein-lysine N-methyltransferase efm6 [Friedmanniomyces endolithicus]